jgi:hypothetical protein
VGGVLLQPMMATVNLGATLKKSSFLPGESRSRSASQSAPGSGNFSAGAASGGGTSTLDAIADDSIDAALEAEELDTSDHTTADGHGTYDNDMYVSAVSALDGVSARAGAGTSTANIGSEEKEHEREGVRFLLPQNDEAASPASAPITEYSQAAAALDAVDPLALTDAEADAAIVRLEVDVADMQAWAYLTSGSQLALTVNFSFAGRAREGVSADRRDGSG